MTHTSGLPGGAPAGGEPPKTLAEHVASVHGATLLFEPGTAWNYSNIGIAALGRIIEVVAGQPYDRFLADRIFQPLAMKDTFFFVPPDKAGRVASVYRYETDGLHLVPMPQPKFPAPEGGLFSTAGDMARFHQMLLNKGTLDGQRILSWYRDGSLRLWDAATGALVGLPMKHRAEVNGALFTADGARILSCSRDGALELWDAATGAFR